MQKWLLFLVVAYPAILSPVAFAAQFPWTLAVIGDQQWAVTQKIGGDYLDRFRTQVDWLAAHAGDINLRMVVQVGDIVENDEEPSKWERASSVMNKSDGATDADGGKEIPWSVAYGNHEIVGLTRPPKSNPRVRRNRRFIVIISARRVVRIGTRISLNSRE